MGVCVERKSVGEQDGITRSTRSYWNVAEMGNPHCHRFSAGRRGEGSDDDLTSEQKAQLTNAGVLDASGRIVPGMINTEDFTGAPMSDPRNPTVGRRFGDRELFESRNKSPPIFLVPQREAICTVQNMSVKATSMRNTKRFPMKTRNG